MYVKLHAKLTAKESKYLSTRIRLKAFTRDELVEVRIMFNGGRV